MNIDLGEFFFFFLGTRVSCEVLEFMELEFHLNFFQGTRVL